jgi:hypothetical protein
LEQYADEINLDECMNCDFTSGTVPSKKLSFDTDLVDMIDGREGQECINSENLYYDYMMREPNTEEAFCEKNVNLFNFEDYFSV